MRIIKSCIALIGMVVASGIDSSTDLTTFTITLTVQNLPNDRVSSLYDPKAGLEDCYVAVKGQWICLPTDSSFEIIKLEQGNSQYYVITAK